MINKVATTGSTMKFIDNKKIRNLVLNCTTREHFNSWFGLQTQEHNIPETMHVMSSNIVKYCIKELPKRLRYVFELISLFAVFVFFFVVPIALSHRSSLRHHVPLQSAALMQGNSTQC